MRVSIIGKFRGKKRFSAFTLVELIVVVTILAILATIGFLALSGYSQDAKDSAIKANVRSVQAAISSEAALTNNSPRYYVVHDTGAALSGAFVYVDGNQTALTGGDWNVSGTNYSAGNPDYAKLKMNPEKFKSANELPVFSRVFAAYDSRYLTVGAMDAVAASTNGGKKRAVSYFQVAGISPTTGSAVVTGNYPASS
ncbi:MAG: type II secretion system protein [Patescibacteria group bacterium]